MGINLTKKTDFFKKKCVCVCVCVYIYGCVCVCICIHIFRLKHGKENIPQNK